MANRIVKIEDICHVVKGETGIMKAIPGEFPMVVLSEERKTHNEYQFDCKAVIIPLVSSTGHGHASMKRIHYQEGKFALGSILCALIPKNEGEYDPEYLYHILDMGKERIFVPLMKGMANVSLPMNRIKSVEINLPPYDEQVRLSKIYSEVTTNLDLLKNQTNKQQKYLKQLRQSILQMAMQGKLTAKWREENPNVEPVSALLEKINFEKEKLIQEGKINRVKSLPKISESEISYELPKSWEWTRIGVIAQHNSGKTLDGQRNKGIPRKYITTSNLYWGYFKLDSLKEMLIKDEELNRCEAEFGDLLVCEGGEAGRAAVWVNYEKVCFQNHIHRIRSFGKIESYFLFRFFEKINLSGEINKYRKGMGISNLSSTALSMIPIPLPPLSEQKEILAKVNQFFNFCDELEKKIEKRDSYQERIMQAVVKQAFTTKIETVETE